MTGIVAPCAFVESGFTPKTINAGLRKFFACNTTFMDTGLGELRLLMMVALLILCPYGLLSGDRRCGGEISRDFLRLLVFGIPVGSMRPTQSVNLVNVMAMIGSNLLLIGLDGPHVDRHTFGLGIFAGVQVDSLLFGSRRLTYVSSVKSWSCTETEIGTLCFSRLGPPGCLAACSACPCCPITSVICERILHM